MKLNSIDLTTDSKESSNALSSISMTIPVVSFEEENQLVTGFYLPNKYSKDNVPKPTGEKVYI